MAQASWTTRGIEEIRTLPQLHRHNAFASTTERSVTRKLAWSPVPKDANQHILNDRGCGPSSRVTDAWLITHASESNDQETLPTVESPQIAVPLHFKLSRRYLCLVSGCPFTGTTQRILIICLMTITWGVVTQTAEPKAHLQTVFYKKKENLKKAWNFCYTENQTENWRPLPWAWNWERVVAVLEATSHQTVEALFSPGLQ